MDSRLKLLIRLEALSKRWGKNVYIKEVAFEASSEEWLEFLVVWKHSLFLGL